VHKIEGTRLTMVAVAAAVLFSAPLAGQGSADGTALVVVPAVAAVELQSASPIETRRAAGGMVSAEGSLLVRVRANHEWRLLVEADQGVATATTAQPAGVDIWWRATVVEEAAAGDFQPLPVGEIAVAAEGGRGRVLIQIDYRWTGEPTARYDAAPIMYTVASN
jgi:hypothetical protein